MGSNWLHGKLMSNKIKEEFSQTLAISALLNSCTNWTLMKDLIKKLNWNYTRMLHAILNKSWKQHSTKQQLYRNSSPISQTIQLRQAGLGFQYQVVFWGGIVNGFSIQTCPFRLVTQQECWVKPTSKEKKVWMYTFPKDISTNANQIGWNLKLVLTIPFYW